jgi:hypothetical protein
MERSVELESMDAAVAAVQARLAKARAELARCEQLERTILAEREFLEKQQAV